MKPPRHILVTRPAGQQQALVQRLERAGFQVTHQPALRIERLPPDAATLRCLQDIDHYHAVFFVSTNAARFALEILEQYWPQWPVGVHWLAVGPATADVLAMAGLPVEAPLTGFDTEAVLTLDALGDLHGKRVLICRGDGGRELMAESLRHRGAEVDVLALYQRACNATFTMPVPAPDLVLVTSLQGWQCIADQVSADSVVIAPSERVAEAIRAQHVRVQVAASATDDDMVQACLALHDGDKLP